MPELPEVETIVRQLRKLVVGQKIVRFRSEWERLTEPEPAALMARRLARRTIRGVRRRGKLVVLDLDRDEALVISLRMTGRLLVRPAGYREADRGVRGVLRFADGSELRFADLRKFGRMALVDAAEITPERGALPGRERLPLHRSLGIEPLSRAFTVDALRAFLARRGRAAIKPLLLDPRGIAGIGNIYACEALWRARIHPRRLAGSLGPAEIARLHEAIRWTLRRGIRLGGASQRDYVDARGVQGRMQREFEVYRRAGEPCSRCGHRIERTVLGGRGTFHCPACQRERKVVKA